MLRNLYFWSVARRHVGEAVAIDNEDAEMAGTLESVGLLGLSFRQANGNVVHLPYGRINAIAVGDQIATNLAARAAHDAERSKAPEPAIFGDELAKMMAEFRP